MPIDVAKPITNPLARKNHETRLVVVESIYHARPDNKTLHLQPGYSKFLTSNEQPYGPRELVARPKWEKINGLWVERASLLVLVNQVKARDLSPQEVEENTIEYTFSKDPSQDYPCILPPEESIRVIPSNVLALQVRSKVNNVP